MDEIIVLQGRKVHLYGDLSAEYGIVQPVDSRDIDDMSKETELLGKLLDGKPYFLAVFAVRDWNAELSPWEAEAAFGTDGFAGRAADTLTYLQKELMPYLDSRSAAVRKTKYVLAGYSLAGLFALWTVYQSDLFCAVAAVSPSVWFPGWIMYAADKRPMTEAVYVSLGDREERTRNPVMCRVGDAIREQYRVLEAQGIPAVLEWNPGNHFKDCEMRVAKGIAWTVNKEDSMEGKGDLGFWGAAGGEGRYG